MSRFYDEDGIDGPWEKAMSRPISAADLIELADQERKRRMESPDACKRCGHDRDLHPWNERFHTGCDYRHVLDGPCRCPSYED